MYHLLSALSRAAALLSAAVILSSTASGQLLLARDTVALSVARNAFPGLAPDSSLQATTTKQIIWEVVVLRWSDGRKQILFDPTSIACDSAGPWLDSVGTHVVFDVLLKTSVRAVIDSGLLPTPSPGNPTFVNAVLPTHMKRTGLASNTSFAPCCGTELHAAYEATWISPGEAFDVVLRSTTGDCMPACPEIGCEATYQIEICLGGAIQ